MQLLQWSLPLNRPSLGQDQVDVWRAALEATPAQYQEHWQVLSPDERERAQRFRFARDREAFVIARGVLRSLLGSYLAVVPEKLTFCYGLQGKPALVPHPPIDLRFNLAHTEGLALYAVAIAREVGIDVERVRPKLNVEAIARRCFSPAENRWLQTLPAEERLQAFFQFWAGKEALIKARGGSIFLNLDQPEAEQAFDLNKSNLPGGWFCCSLTPGPGYTAALAVAGYPIKVQCWQWSPAAGEPLV